MIEVTNVSELTAAIASATPGTVIEVKAGTYAISSPLRTQSAGAQGNPIVLRGAAGTLPKLDFSNTDEGLVIGHADWTIENLWVNGACDGGGCGNDAGGVHIKAEGSRITIRQSRITNWEEDIKSDRSAGAEPTDCVLVGNEIYNDSPGFTTGGTGIDLVGGIRWHIVGNYIHDYAREETHYGIFVKGGGKDAVIERNLVVGAKNIPAGSGSAVGISFGGGGTGAQFCATNNVGTDGCACEAFGGIARNNIVAKVSDAGLHTKRACGSVFAYNTVYDTGIGLQIQIVGAAAPVELRGTVMSKGVSGALTSDNNLLNVSATDFKKFYADPDALDFRDGTDTSGLKGKGTALATVTDDYFGVARPAPPTLGAIEQPTTGSTWPWNAASSADAGAPIPPDGSSSGGASSSSGGVSSSGGTPSDSSSPSSDSSDGGGCTSAGTRSGVGGALALMALVFVLRRRRY